MEVYPARTPRGAAVRRAGADRGDRAIGKEGERGGIPAAPYTRTPVCKMEKSGGKEAMVTSIAIRKDGPRAAR